MQSHFANLTNAVVVAPEALVSASQAALQSKLPDQDSMEDKCCRDMHDVLSGFFGAVIPFKAFEEACIPPAAYRAAPESFAHVYAPFCVSSYVCSREPVHWSGGLLHDIPKKTTSEAVESLRGVLLEDHSGKAFHHVVRQELLPGLQSYVLQSLHGGLLKRGTDFGSIHLHALSNFAQNQGLSFGCFFADVSAALERVQRSLVFGDRLSDEPLRFCLVVLISRRKSFRISC